MALKYYPMDLAYDDQAKGRFIHTKDVWPIPAVWWRNNPLSDNSYIRPNVAGYFPYPQIKEKETSSHHQEWEFAYNTVCSTIVPDNPQYQKTKEIIMYR
jgi:hypothetical protein